MTHARPTPPRPTPRRTAPPETPEQRAYQLWRELRLSHTELQRLQALLRGVDEQPLSAAQRAHLRHLQLGADILQHQQQGLSFAEIAPLVGRHQNRCKTARDKLVKLLHTARRAQGRVREKLIRQRLEGQTPSAHQQALHAAAVAATRTALVNALLIHHGLYGTEPLQQLHPQRTPDR